MFLVVAAVLALAAAEPAAQQSEPVTVAPATAVAPPKLEGVVDARIGDKKVKMVCKEVVKANSRFGKKQCVELEAYKRQQEIDRQAFEETQNRPMISTARGN